MEIKHVAIFSCLVFLSQAVNAEELTLTPTQMSKTTGAAGVNFLPGRFPQPTTTNNVHEDNFEINQQVAFHDLSVGSVIFEARQGTTKVSSQPVAINSYTGLGNMSFRAGSWAPPGFFEPLNFTICLQGNCDGSFKVGGYTPNSSSPWAVYPDVRVRVDPSIQLVYVNFWKLTGAQFNSIFPDSWAKDIVDMINVSPRTISESSHSLPHSIDTMFKRCPQGTRLQFTLEKIQPLGLPHSSKRHCHDLVAMNSTYINYHQPDHTPAMSSGLFCNDPDAGASCWTQFSDADRATKSIGNYDRVYDELLLNEGGGLHVVFVERIRALHKASTATENADGIAFINGKNSIVFVKDGLSKQRIAQVIAHELGHLAGLQHSQSSACAAKLGRVSDDLMCEVAGSDPSAVCGNFYNSTSAGYRKVFYK